LGSTEMLRNASEYIIVMLIGVTLVFAVIAPVVKATADSIQQSAENIERLTR
jgi:hypothetical protein